MTAGAGTVFVTVGTGGIPPRPATGGDPESGHFAAVSAAGRNPTHGFVELHVSATSPGADFVRAAGGTFADHWVLQRPASP